MEAPNQENDNKQVLKETKQAEANKDDKEDQKKEEGASQQKTEEESDDLANTNFTEYLKDYESLLTYSLKLLEDNKKLMEENLHYRTEAENMVKMNLVLIDQNEKLKNERDKLVTDSVTLIEYNDHLQASKDALEKDLIDIKDKFYAIIGGMQDITEYEKETLEELENKANNSPSGPQTN